MKKILFFTMLCVAVSASPAVYITSCGEPVASVDMNYFKTFDEWQSYVAELDEIYCGSNINSDEITIRENLNNDGIYYIE